jgi:hypothetical protein
MKRLRLGLLLVIACGAAFLVADTPFDAGTWPLPAPNFSIRIPFKLRFPGDYLIELSMPRASADQIHVVDESLPCRAICRIRLRKMGPQNSRAESRLYLVLVNMVGLMSCFIRRVRRST